MGIYSGRQDLLDEALEEYFELGFSLEEEGDHFLNLYFKDKKIATYIQENVTRPIIHEGCKNYLASFIRNQED